MHVRVTERSEIFFQVLILFLRFEHGGYIKRTDTKKALHFCRAFFLKVVGEEGFEPPTLWSQTRCATKLRYSPRCLTSRIACRRGVYYGFLNLTQVISLSFFAFIVRLPKTSATGHKV